MIKIACDRLAYHFALARKKIFKKNMKVTSAYAFTLLITFLRNIFDMEMSLLSDS